MTFFYRSIMPIATFDLIPAEYTTEHMYNFDYDNHDAYNNGLEEVGYDTCNALLNLGSVYLFMLVKIV